VIREAIARGDVAAARRTTVEHVRRAGELVAGWYERRGALQAKRNRA
jgi:hypothetical protein